MLAKSEGITVRGGIQYAFCCRYEGKITEGGIDVGKVAAISTDFQAFLGIPLQGLMYSLYQNKDIKIT